MFNINFEVETLATVQVRGKPWSLDLAKFAKPTFARVFQYGLQRMVNDSVGPCGKPDKLDEDGKRLYADTAAWQVAIDAAAGKTVDMLYSGDFKKERAASVRESVDPVLAEAYSIISREVARKLAAKRAAGDKLAKMPKPAELMPMLDKIYAANVERYTTLAVKAIAERADALDGVDLSAFGL